MALPACVSQCLLIPSRRTVHRALGDQLVLIICLRNIVDVDSALGAL